MKVVFEKGSRGLICRSPEDDGAWVVPAHHVRHAAQPKDGHIVAVEIVGASANGRLRFARIVKDISADQETALAEMRKALESAVTLDDVKGRKWGGLGVVTHISPWAHNIKTCLDESGRVVVTSTEVVGFLKQEWGEVELCTYDAPAVKMKRPLPLGPAEAPLVLAYWVLALATPGHTSETTPTWAMEFVSSAGELSESVRLLEERTGKEWYPRPKPSGYDKDWPVMYWLCNEAKRVGALNLRDLVAKVELPLMAVKEQLITLTIDRPTHVRFNDGHERAVRWVGSSGRVWVPREIYSALTLIHDERVSAVKAAGNTLWLETSWEETTCGSRRNDFDSRSTFVQRKLE